MCVKKHYLGIFFSSLLFAFFFGEYEKKYKKEICTFLLIYSAFLFWEFWNLNSMQAEERKKREFSIKFNLENSVVES